MPDLIGIKSKLIAGGAALVLVLLVYGVQEWRISGMNDTIDKKNTEICTLTRDLAINTANVAKLKATVDRQNSAVETLKPQKAIMDAAARKTALQARAKRQETVSTEGVGPDAMNSFFERLFQ
jgi:hypothetical protein